MLVAGNPGLCSLLLGLGDSSSKGLEADAAAGLWVCIRGRRRELRESPWSELMGKGTETPFALLACAKEEQGPLLNIHAVRQGLLTPLTTAIQH